MNFTEMYEDSIDLIATNIPKLSIDHSKTKTTLLINGKKRTSRPKWPMFALRGNLLESVKFILEKRST
ncbi:MAG: hypothetical protein R2877_02695 [Bdellovibrionota bacterium]